MAETLYDLMGGEAGIRALTSRFYALMDSEPEAKACRAVHPSSLKDSEEKLFEYLTGWLGGPPLYTDKRGPPMLRQRHFIAKIGDDEISGWLHCFKKAWAEQVNDSRLSEVVMPRVEALALHMKNI